MKTAYFAILPLYITYKRDIGNLISCIEHGVYNLKRYSPYAYVHTLILVKTCYAAANVTQKNVQPREKINIPVNLLHGWFQL